MQYYQQERNSQIRWYERLLIAQKEKKYDVLLLTISMGRIFSCSRVFNGILLELLLLPSFVRYCFEQVGLPTSYLFYSRNFYQYIIDLLILLFSIVMRIHQYFLIDFLQFYLKIGDQSIGIPISNSYILSDNLRLTDRNSFY